MEEQIMQLLYYARLMSAHKDVVFKRISLPLLIQEALLEKQEVDAVFLDIDMPGMDGFETLKRLREQEKGKEDRRAFQGHPSERGGAGAP